MWVLYDVANSAYALMVTTTIFPLFYKNAIAASVPSAISTARLAFASSAFTLVVAVLATVLGPLADYEGRKKRFFTAFFGLGVAATCLLAFVPAGQELAVLAVFGLSVIGFAAANVFYDSFLTGRHLARTHGPPVGGRLCLGLRGIDGSLRAVDGARQPRPRHRCGLADDRGAHRVPHCGPVGGRYSRCRCCVAYARCTSFGRWAARRSWLPCATASGG